MNKIIIFLFGFLLVTFNALAADTKITGLTADSSPTTDDLIVTVDDPGGSPVNKKVTIGAVQTLISHDAVTIATGTDSITVTGQELDVSSILEEFSDLTPTNNAILGFNGSGAIENKTSISVDVDLGVQASTTAGRLGRTTGNQITMGDNAGTGTVNYSPTDDTATNGDTAKSWSADKVYDQLALKEGTVSAGSLADNSVYSADINTIVETITWNAGGTNSDGTQCAAAAKVTINSGPQVETTICADNDASTIYGHVKMPDSWNGGTVTMASEYIQTAADTGVLNGDIACQCRGAGETVNNTWGTEVAIDDAAVTGSNGSDVTTSAAMTCDGTCAAGDVLYWRYQIDATGTTTAVATLHFVSWSMEYTSNVGD